MADRLRTIEKSFHRQGTQDIVDGLKGNHIDVLFHAIDHAVSHSLVSTAYSLDDVNTVSCSGDAV